MAVARYRYRMVNATVDVTDLANKSDPATLAAVGQSQGQIIDWDIESTRIGDLDDALAALGYTRIAGPGVVGTPGDASEFVRRTGDTMTGNLVMSGATITGLPLVPTTPTEAASMAYVDAKVISGRIWREALLVQQQLANGAAGGIKQAELFAFTSAVAVGNTFRLTDGTTTETWTAVAAAPVAFQFIGGVSASADQAALIAAINADSTLWDAIGTSGLDTYFASLPGSQFVVYRTIPTITANDRAYGTLSSASAIKAVEFATGAQDYTQFAGTESNLPAADPAAKRFGFGRIEAGLITVETHFVVEDNSQWTWDDDDQLWRLTGGTSSGSSSITWGAEDVASSTTIRFLYPGFDSAIAQVTEVEWDVPRNGTMRRIYVRHNDVGAAATLITYTLMVNGVATALAVSLAASGTAASNIVSSVVVSAGDRVTIRVTKAANLVGVRPGDIMVSVEFAS